MGPTAAGKTAAAMTLFDRLPVELISVDSAQVYRGLDIGSAKATPAEQQRYPHALIDIREPEQAYSAAEFVKDAEQVMRECAASGRLPVLVGGTALYFRALLYGLDDLPPADPDLRARLQARAEREGWLALHRQLAARDPAAVRVIRPSDHQRIIRALELIELTGQGPGELFSHPRRPRFPSLRLVLTPADRRQLHQAIAQRLAVMFDQGFLAEVEGLRARPELTADTPSMRAVGYRQAWAHLDGEYDQEECLARCRAATRQLAKRQLTAFRQFGATLWYDSGHGQALDRVVERVKGFAGC
ncbi:MAG: tRNA (adenosine(37)-N6)-dimethylallyltransferase MiaA [Wenzhouxiangella sp.]